MARKPATKRSRPLAEQTTTPPAEPVAANLRPPQPRLDSTAELARALEQLGEAATAAAARVEELEAALRPFAELEVEFPLMGDDVIADLQIRYRDWRRARRALGLEEFGPREEP